MKTFSLAAALLATGLLAACSGSSGSSGRTQSNFDDAIDFIDAAGPDAENIRSVSVDQLPNRATMSGQMLAGMDRAESTFVGDATATANFATGRIAGRATNFTEYESSAACDSSRWSACTGREIQDLGGTLDIAGRITDTTFSYDTQGKLTGTDAELGPVVADIHMDGVGRFGQLNNQLVAIGVQGGTAVLSSDSGRVTSEIAGVLILSE